MKPRPILLLAIAVLALPRQEAHAQTAFKFIQADDAAKMVFDPDRAKEAANIVKSDGFRMALGKHTESSRVEKHMAYDEELVIQEGDVVLNYGGDGVNARENRPGEWQADSIAGGESVEMHPGDIVVIPPNTWHEEVLKSPRMRYILLQSARKE